jgi:hypothetical protein
VTDVKKPDFNYYKGIGNAIKNLSGGESVNLSAQNNININLTPGLNVFDVNSSQLTGYKTVDFIGNGIVVFRVKGDVKNWSWSVNYDPSKIIWSFDGDVNVNNRQFTGWLIATGGDVTQSQNINGGIITNDWNVYNSAELHSYNMAAIPEPTSAAMVLGSIGLIFVLRRR